MSGYISRLNGKKGGRPSYKTEITAALDGIQFVILTEHQYNSLIERYGYAILEKALNLLEKWLSTSPDAVENRRKNHYAYFRRDGWLINSILDYRNEMN